MDDLIKHYQRQFSERLQDFVTHSDCVLTWRKQAMEMFSQLGFPTRKDEAWKYLNLRSFFQQSFPIFDPTDEVSATKPKVMIDPDSYFLYFYNGCFVPSYSILPSTQIVEINQLANAIAGKSEWLTQYLIPETPIQNAFDALNQAFMQNGYLIKIKEGAQLDKPIVIHFYNDKPQAVILRNILIAEPHASVKIVEQYMGEMSYFNNVITKFWLSNFSEVTHYKIIDESPLSFHFGHTEVQQQAGKLNGYLFTLNGGLIRSDTTVNLIKQSAECNLSGNYCFGNNQIMDHHICVNHLVSGTQSKQYFKGMGVGGEATFDGKIRVEKQANQTNSHLTNRNLLLDQQAKINTKPQLEIFADDVVCSHGATIGELDQAALFYLQSRGIEADQAKQMLLQAFIDELLDTVDETMLQSYLRQLHYSKLMSMEAEHD